MKSLWICLVVVSMLTVAGCTKNGQEKQDQQAQQEQPPVLNQAPASTPTSAGGVKWTVPARWTVEGERPMRVGTYAVPAAAGDAEGGECAAYYFGANQGGDVQANVDRWATQFEGVTGRNQTTSEVHGMQVTNVVIAGTYLAPAGPMMQSQGKKAHYTLLGAIIEAPNGRVFFKFTGPDKTVEASKADFDALLQSVTKE
jgi:hypothetical protein